MSDPDLLLHLPLDELQGEKLPDLSSGRRNAINHGAAIVEDVAFGQCLELKGGADSYVQLASLKEAMRGSHALTVMLWINPPVEKGVGLYSTTPMPNHCLLELAHLYDLDTQAFGISFRKVSNRELVASVYGGDFVRGTSTPYHLDDHRLQAVTSGWMHLTFIRDPNGQEFYLNGVPFSTYQSKVIRNSPGTSPATLRDRDPLPGHNPLYPASAAPSNWLFPPRAGQGRPDLNLLGKSQIGVKEIGVPFVGGIAHLRVYRRALTQEEMNWHIEGDRTVQYRYRITHPVDFSLENRDADPTLFMDGHPEGQTMSLRINNVTGGVVQLAPPQGTPPSKTDAEAMTSWIASNCQFELAFRPGTLEVGSIGKVTIATPNIPWVIASKTWAAPDDRDSLYLLCTQPGPLPGGGLTLELGHLLPDARYGTRTTLVDFRYKNLKSGSGETISGSVQQNLELVNHLGRRNIPLHVGFTGSNLVLNNSDKPTELRLRVTNVLPRTDLYDDPHKAVATGILRFDDKSEFFLFFDERPGTDWALNGSAVIKDIVVHYDKGGITKTSPEAKRIDGSEGKPYQWKIPLKGLSLGPEEHLEILLQNVKAAGSDGHSNLYLDYRDVPGYWNGRFTTVIEKAPLIYRNCKVGIGVADPEVDLHVKGTLKVDTLVVVKRTPTRMVDLTLINGWKPKDAKAVPRYFRDSQGMIHLTGVCVYQVPWVKDQDFSASNWLVLQALVDKKGPFILTDDCLPIAEHEFRFPSHVKCYTDSAHQSWRSWHPLHICDSIVYPVLDLTEERGVSPDEKPRIGLLDIYLDGISYPAKS